uniref:RUN and FYVE domain-containing protein 4 n=1 Tax=Nomascus leucogenys TaxID=61853 RepID=A0A2I3G0E1_NOMLE
MAEKGAILKVTKDLRAAVSAILQGYGDGQGPVTDTSAELHRLCGCLELLLQFDQKEQKSFLGPRKDYWDFLCTALRRQRGDMEPIHFVRSQDKLKTPLGKGRAFIRFCLAHGQLAEALQLCLLNPELTREWYGPRSPLLCPEHQEDMLDSLYALNGVAFELDLQQPDLDEAWPMFSESHCSSSTQTQGRRPRKNKHAPKKIPATYGGPENVQIEDSHTSQAICLQDAPSGQQLAGLPGSHILGEPWVLQGLATKEDSTVENPQVQTEVTRVARREEQAEVSLQDEIKSLRLGFRKAEEQAQSQEQLLRQQEGELQALREQLKEEAEAQRCCTIHPPLDKQQEAERRDAMYQEELGGQRDLVQAMKRRVLELIQEKDRLWQRLQHLSSMAPGCCVACSKIFGRLSRRYPCRLCGGLLCHTCSMDYKKRDRCCPPCAQGGEAQVT